MSMVRLSSRNYICVCDGKVIEVVGKDKDDARIKACNYFVTRFKNKLLEKTTKVDPITVSLYEQNVIDKLQIAKIPSIIGVLE